MPEFLALVEQDTVVQAKLFIASLASPDFYVFHRRTVHEVYNLQGGGVDVLLSDVRF